MIHRLFFLWLLLGSLNSCLLYSEAQEAESYLFFALEAKEDTQPFLKRTFEDHYETLTQQLAPQYNALFRPYLYRLRHLGKPLQQHLENMKAYLEEELGTTVDRSDGTNKTVVATLWEQSTTTPEQLALYLDSVRRAYQAFAGDILGDTSHLFKDFLLPDHWLALPSSALLYDGHSFVLKRAMLAEVYALIVQLENDILTTKIHFLKALATHLKRSMPRPWVYRLAQTPLPKTLRVGQTYDIAFNVYRQTNDGTFQVLIENDTVTATNGQLHYPLIPTQTGTASAQVAIYWLNPLTGTPQDHQFSIPYSVIPTTE